MWTKTVKGVEISGRKIMLQKRFDMSYNMGGLQLEKVENTVRRIILIKLPSEVYNSGEREGTLFEHIVGSKFNRKCFFVDP
jgi:hypothetical protein